jgi:hypothetical protein
MELAREEGVQRAGISKSERDSERRPLAFFGQRERRNGWLVILRSHIHNLLELNFFLKNSKLVFTIEITSLLEMLLVGHKQEQECNNHSICRNIYLKKYNISLLYKLKKNPFYFANEPEQLSESLGGSSSTEYT